MPDPVFNVGEMQQTTPLPLVQPGNQFNARTLSGVEGIQEYLPHTRAPRRVVVMPELTRQKLDKIKRDNLSRSTECSDIGWSDTSGKEFHSCWVRFRMEKSPPLSTLIS